MNRMIRAATAAAILTAGLGSVGCVHTGGGCGTAGGCGAGGAGGAKPDGLEACYRNLVDPCYPERYEHAARQSVIAPFAQQVHNGHVLNQTIWNYYFEAGTDKLTPSGFEKLDSLTRTRPAPDPKLFIQTARDLSPALEPAKLADARADLDTRRAAAILRYMSAQPAFTPVVYEVYVHDAPVPGINAEMAIRSYNGSFQGYRGGVSGSGTGVLGTGGTGNLTAAPTSGGATGSRP